MELWRKEETALRNKATWETKNEKHCGDMFVLKRNAVKKMCKLGRTNGEMSRGKVV